MTAAAAPVRSTPSPFRRLLVDYAIVWVVLIVVGILLGLGLSWSLLRAKVTGQIESV